jgi:cell division protein FtsB
MRDINEAIRIRQQKYEQLKREIAALEAALPLLQDDEQYDSQTRAAAATAPEAKRWP